MILDGKKLSKELYAQLKLKINELKTKPCLAVILVGDDYASGVYVRSKLKACNELGIISKDYKLDSSISEEELLKIIRDLNDDDSVDAILVQLPLPNHINKDNIINAINPIKDVDGFTPLNLGLVLANLKPHFYACTPLGIDILMKHYGICVKGKNICIINDSIIVGRPLAAMMINEGASVSVCHKYTKNLKEHTLNADILISATGVIHLINDDFIKNGAILIDVGICKEIDGKKLSGDYLKTSNKASMITPVPGGVGPMTIYALMQNTYEARLKKEENARK
ncbi:bifunctional 5,10-methylenetetrahydrofolate dehydrogenase/5,10-methenyltetrahydrofolate cyclohydrolase [Campylobacter sp. 2018MI13]|uniref:bifunctional 5,10-methylenetetrahydrofolate dehydrogenase/5,10-methenyltetrahydrofolate cyclohydrolase n=1 Tax=Campylobacter sp. 2018MI13 TaxID=2836737 RepID=UPI001BDA9F37|nr:bifunctional 5,10-methylenetetrahydrofolate dehydrogenase/5,10-methenyltetrahydrofolate cyclohydrolase [Campylobacter sp. 2018MI13]MBT0883329.1 bifunctional 5,10-methylenetetrahydrofolate dehydrogenase/5,10-methenyltetrahydrofolate cyclohydrolase [Campylobacter sp. 2018MI13]